MDATTARKINAELDEAVNAVLAGHGFASPRGGTIRYARDGSSLSFKVEAVLTDADAVGDIDAAKRAEFGLYAEQYGVSVEAFGTEFTYGGRSYRLTGVLPKGRTNVFLALNLSDNKQYRLPRRAATAINEAAGVTPPAGSAGGVFVDPPPRTTGDADAKRAEFEAHCGRFGLPAEAFGIEFEYFDTTYRLDGLKPNSPKNFLLLTDMDKNKQYVAGESFVEAIVAHVPD